MTAPSGAGEGEKAARVNLHEVARKHRAESKARSEQQDAARQKELTEHTEQDYSAIFQQVIGVPPDVLTVTASGGSINSVEVAAAYGELKFGRTRNGFPSLLLPDCPQCGNPKMVQIASAADLYYALAPDFDDNHRCPHEPEDWRINRDVREAEIAARQERRDAQQPSGLQALVDEITGTALELPAVQLVRAVQAFASAAVDGVRYHGEA